MKTKKILQEKEPEIKQKDFKYKIVLGRNFK